MSDMNKVPAVLGGKVAEEHKGSFVQEAPTRKDWQVAVQAEAESNASRSDLCAACLGVRHQTGHHQLVAVL